MHTAYILETHRLPQKFEYRTVDIYSMFIAKTSPKFQRRDFQQSYSERSALSIKTRKHPNEHWNTSIRTHIFTLCFAHFTICFALFCSALLTFWHCVIFPDLSFIDATNWEYPQQLSSNNRCCILHSSTWFQLGKRLEMETWNFNCAKWSQGIQT